MSNRLHSHHIFPRLALAAALFFCAALQPLHAAPAKSTKTKTPKAAAAPKTTPATYKGAIVINAENGDILFQDHPDVLNPPASVTKLMTFLVVHDAIAAGTLALDTPVRITVEDSKIGGTQVYLDPRETFPVEELLYALMIQSANDAASALAHAAAGSREAFVERMNARARDLGMTRTTFVTPHGLPPASRRIADGDLTTPRDLAILARYLINNTNILKYTSVRFRKFGVKERAPDRQIDMKNHNNLLGQIPGLDGLKTGFTNGAGFCLAATAERNGNRVIAVTMGSPDSKSRDLKIAELINNALAKLPAGGHAKPAMPVSNQIPADFGKRSNAVTIDLGFKLPDAPATSDAPQPSPIAPASSSPATNFVPPVAPASATGTTAPAALPTVTYPAPK